MAAAPQGKAFSLRKYDPTFLVCRDIQHAFEIIGYYRSSDGYTRRRLRCLRCGTIGRDTLSVVGERHKGRSYQHPEGYLIEGGLPRTTVRMEEMRRATIFRSEEDMIAEIIPASKRKRDRKATYAVKHRARQKAKA